jgi:hypothetical protein
MMGRFVMGHFGCASNLKMLCYITWIPINSVLLAGLRESLTRLDIPGSGMVQ